MGQVSRDQLSPPPTGGQLLGFSCGEGEKLLFHVQRRAHGLIAAIVAGFSKPDNIYLTSNEQEVV